MKVFGNVKVGVSSGGRNERVEAWSCPMADRSPFWERSAHRVIGGRALSAGSQAEALV